MGIRTPKQKYRRFQMRQHIWEREKSDRTSRACGKVRFKTELDAKIALAGARRQRRGPARQKDEQRYYRCPECHGYHLTSKPYRGRNRKEPNASKTTIIQTAAKLKGVSVFIERIGDAWIYTIPEFDAYGTTGSQEEAKTAVQTIMKFVDPSVTASFRYYADDQDIEMFYAQQVAGPQAIVTAEKSSYMEPLLSQMRSFLFRHGYRFRKYDSRYPGPPDIVLPKHHIMVFVDPCLWHDRSECRRKALPPETLRLWREHHIGQWEEMQEERRRLFEEGWTILSYWECRFYDNRKRARRLNAFLSDVRRCSHDRPRNAD
ncbi:DNA mismatch endonuclease Vsr [Bifidobacterium margollesii]|uniref:DNA mismatch endonuclease Vsr n=1 Tax=Bifidobacterium margollesii TaxID=2020964 RepID=A0A2N5J9I4_9BIFI|nr:very short patch repair endonuclease [Bifidobacterium margollesii]PLS30865.1 DNA mismatch endonuclease Vsr [Bifidobacterium margollesii]